MTRKTGKLNANKPIGEGPDCREHGTKYKTGVRGVLTPDAVRSYAAKGMSLGEIAYFHGCTKMNICGAIKEDLDLQQAWNEGISAAIEKATNCLLRNIENDNVLAAMFLLKCKHLSGEKGWLEEQHKQKIVDTESAPRVHIYLPGNGRDSIPDAVSEDFLIKNGPGD